MSQIDDDHTDDMDDEERFLDRRRFLQLLVAGSATAAGGAVIYSGRERIVTSTPAIEQPSTQVGVVTRANAAPETAGRLLDGANDNRVLVLIELVGGNDGLSTVVPYNSGNYYDLRPNIAIQPEEVLPLDDQVGLNPNLARLHARGIALVEGVGPIDGNLSHFEMVQRWDAGDVDGTSDLRSGFLARLVEQHHQDDPLQLFDIEVFILQSHGTVYDQFPAGRGQNSHLFQEQQQPAALGIKTRCLAVGKQPQ